MNVSRDESFETCVNMTRWGALVYRIRKRNSRHDDWSRYEGPALYVARIEPRDYLTADAALADAHALASVNPVGFDVIDCATHACVATAFARDSVIRYV